MAFSTNAQLTIDFPVNNAVFQRNNSNVAKIDISGGFTSKNVTSIQARLVIPGTATPIAGFDWTIISVSPSKGFYFGTLFNVPAGWYTLELRELKTGIVGNTTSLSRIGVGDVFMAFGQSNAQGLENYGQVGATSDKVVTHNYLDGCTTVSPPLSNLSQIQSTSYIGQHGLHAWFYGKLGDQIVNNTGYPVAFFNGASSAASLQNFIDSFDGGPTNHYFTGGQFCDNINPAHPNGVGTPYLTFINSLRMYNSLYGIRAILFAQGETETLQGVSQATYQTRLNTVINRVRSDFGNMMPWVIARSSYFSGSSSSSVIAAQNSVIGSGSQLFAGPSTDDYNNVSVPGSRDGNDVHFNNFGLIEIANRWNTQLTTPLSGSNNFFNLSSPILAKDAPEVTVSLSGNNVTLTAVPTGVTYTWVTGNNINTNIVSTSQSLTASSGSYRCFIRDTHGRITVTSVFDISKIRGQLALPASLPDSVSLTNFTLYSMTNGFGPIAINKNAGSLADGDGGAILLDGTTYPLGYGVHSGSELVFRNDSLNYDVFTATIGIDDVVSSGANVIFKVYADNTLLYTSPAVTQASSKIDIMVPISGLSFNFLKLVVENNGGSVSSNKANWANPVLKKSPPYSVSITDIKTKCMQLNWQPNYAQNNIVSFEIYKDGVLETTVPANTNSYIVGNLSRNSTYSLGIKSVNNLGNKSSLIQTSATTESTVNVRYTSNNFVCQGDTLLPYLITPAGGTFKINSGGNIATVDANTGELYFTGTGSVGIRYVLNSGTSCGDSINFFVTAGVKPAAPTVSVNHPLINVGDTATLSSTSCGSYAFQWIDNNTDLSREVVLTDTTSYYAYCSNNSCIGNSSNTVQVKVIPNCKDAFVLVSPTDDISDIYKLLQFKASQTIQAANQLTNGVKVSYKAANSILLTPGFSASGNTVFSATIGGCP